MRNGSGGIGIIPDTLIRVEILAKFGCQAMQFIFDTGVDFITSEFSAKGGSAFGGQKRNFDSPLLSDLPVAGRRKQTRGTR